MTRIDARLATADEATDRREERGNQSLLERITAVELAMLGGVLVLLSFLWGRGRHVWFWLDEGIAVGIASHPVGRIPGLLRQDGSPPLYYELLHLWMSAFGTSDQATRLLSLVFALAMVPTALWAGWSLFGRRAGWMAVVLVAISPFVAAYANETRMYTLVALLGLVATATFLHGFVFRRRRYIAGFVIALVLLLYTHNWGIFFVAGAGAALLGCIAVTPSEARRGMLLDGILAFGAAGILYAPWLPSLAYQLSHTGAPFTLRPTLLIVRADLMKLLGGPEALVALGFGSGVAFLTILRRPWTLRAIAVLAAAAIVVVAIGAGWALSRQNSVWVYRYLAVVVGPMVLVLAAGLAEGGRTAVAGLAIAAVLVAPIAVKGQPYEKSNVRNVTTRLGPMLDDGDLVITDFGRVPLLRHYLRPGIRYAETTGPVADPRTSDQRDATKRLAAGVPEVTLRQPIEALTAGAHVLVVCSAGQLPLDATPFLRLIFERCQEALALISRDARFRLEASVAAPPYGSNNPVNGFLFSRVDVAAT